MPLPAQDPQPVTIGAQIRALRQARRMSLYELSSRVQLSEATLSRIENGISAVSAPHLYRLAKALNVDIATFFTDQGPGPSLRPGMRSLTRHDQGVAFNSDRLSAKLLCADLLNKQMNPFINQVSATDLAEVGGLQAHDGEEFLFVVAGNLCLHAEGYAPLILSCGDSIYFDARQPHAYLAADKGGARFLVVTSDQSNSLRKALHDGT